MLAIHSLSDCGIVRGGSVLEFSEMGREVTWGVPKMGGGVFEMEGVLTPLRTMAQTKSS